jgi:hypothetical protein
MDLIVHDPGRYHVSLDTVWEFEEAVSSDPRIHTLSSKGTLLPHIPNIVWRILYRLMNRHGDGRKAAPAGHRPGLKDDTFAVLMGPNIRKTMPRFLAQGRKSIYLFDAWPCNHKKIRLFAESCHIDYLFASSSQGTAMLSDALKKTSCHWIPEGITPEDYYLAFTPEKDIDVLQLGRRYNHYHDLIAKQLDRQGKVYLYEKQAGKVIFPTRLDYVEGLARSKISICVPSALTHPHLAGGIETMTVRYLQSMFSKCLIVGHAPSEMIQLFGYNPVVEIDFTDPVKQLLHLLNNLSEYRPLIEKNYQVVLAHHTWRHRWEKISKILFGQSAPTSGEK